jgi:hypothetical protein
VCACQNNVQANWKEKRRRGEDYLGIIDRENVKLSRLLLVSERDWRKLPAEAGAERTKSSQAKSQLSP